MVLRYAEFAASRKKRKEKYTRRIDVAFFPKSTEEFVYDRSFENLLANVISGPEWRKKGGKKAQGRTMVR